MSAIEFSSPSGMLALFDPQSLKHMLLKPRGWWQDEQQALHEIRNGRMALVALDLPGTYLVRQLSDGDFERHADEEFRPVLSFYVSCPTGRLFVGRAESTTGDELEPDEEFGDITLALSAGTQQVQLARSGDFDLLMNIEPSSAKPRNEFNSLPQLSVR